MESELCNMLNSKLASNSFKNTKHKLQFRNLYKRNEIARLCGERSESRTSRGQLQTSSYNDDNVRFINNESYRNSSSRNVDENHDWMNSIKGSYFFN